jgi:hypothetical protein
MPIGTLNEGSLHRALKATYAANGGAEEVPINGFVADAVREGVVYEVQTGSFSGLARKMRSLADELPVVLIHPIAANTTIIKQPTEGDKASKRLSPKHGRPVHIVSELIYIPTLLNHPNFSVEVVLIEEQEVREFDPKKRRGRGGWRVRERTLLKIVEGVRLREMSDLFEFLKTELAEPFTTQTLAEALGEPRAIAQKMAYCLKHAGITEVSGKIGNALQYRSC